MSLLDHSFHDFDIDQWINNFDELTEPEYLYQSIDDIKLSPESQEVLALLKKDTSNLFDSIVEVLGKQEMQQLYLWALAPGDFVKDTGILLNDDRYTTFLSEFIPGYILYKNQWDRNQFGKEIRTFIKTLPQPHTNKRNSRIKTCKSCGYNLSDDFAVRLTADNILDDTPVAVVCTHCNTLNYFKY